MKEQSNGFASSIVAYAIAFVLGYIACWLTQEQVASEVIKRLDTVEMRLDQL